MRDVIRDAERTRRELSAMGLEHVRIKHFLDDEIRQPRVSAYWRVSYAENEFDPQSALAEAECVARVIDRVLPGYRSGPACMVGAKGVIRVSMDYDPQAA